MYETGDVLLHELGVMLLYEMVNVLLDKKGAVQLFDMGAVLLALLGCGTRLIDLRLLSNVH